jgi:hypothetical protein
MARNPIIKRLLTGVCVALPLGLTLSPLAQAAWSAGGSGSAIALAYLMPNGSQPAVSVSGTSVTVTWPVVLFPDNHSVAGYLIERFNASSGAQAIVGANCSGTVSTTSCTEQNVPAGNWIYTDTPLQDLWTGGQSPASPVATVP